ncbi:hypothetical protein CP8484711_1760, partial [Chlamydia psittaci 84-8471/1]
LAYQNNLITFACIKLNCRMNLSYQDTSRIYIKKIPSFRLLTNLWRDTMSRINHLFSTRNILKIFYKNCPASLEIINYMTVVNNFMFYINRSSPFL